MAAKLANQGAAADDYRHRRVNVIERSEILSESEAVTIVREARR